MLWEDLIRQVKLEGDARIHDQGSKYLSDYLNLLYKLEVHTKLYKSWKPWDDYIKRVLHL